MPSYKQKKARLRQLVKQQEQQRIDKIKHQGHKFVNSDEFKRQQKHFKYYIHRETDYSEMLNTKDMKMEIVNGYEVYKIPEPQGAFLIKGFISLKQQYMVGFEALNQYIFRPYRTNLDGTNGLYHQNATQNENQTKQTNTDEHNNLEVKKGNIINIKLQNDKILEGVDPNNKQAPYHFNQKIRMSNLGYQYDWPHRSYPATRVSIPQTITKLTKKAAQIYEKIRKEPIKYHGQAVIVNYYKNRDYMTGHLDDGQEDQVNPIFSFCFGLSCVFLLGYPTRNKKPRAIRLDAGDLLIMSGYSRICYHGVPRIIEDSYSLEQILQKEQHREQVQNIKAQIEKIIEVKKQELKDSQHIDKRYLNGFEHVNNYLKEHRLNINVRQVWVRKDEAGQGVQKDTLIVSEQQKISSIQSTEPQQKEYQKK